MAIRSLCGALVLLVFTAPLNALLCASCAAGGHCTLTGTVETTPEPSEPQAESHCHPAKETKAESNAESAACHDLSSAMAASDCCAVTAAPEPENAAIATGSMPFEVVLELSPEDEAPIFELNRLEEQRHQPPRLAPQPLYTLHSAFLI